mmetsp:Transcript_29837/g.70917  ORF Transcript_29837/g.70917 Transcript_29837/m.70917 type:complete len:557 (+) Transcript_29837:194-1864(+)
MGASKSRLVAPEPIAETYKAAIRSGPLTASSLQQHLRAGGTSWDIKRCAALMVVLDEDGNGNVDENEFVSSLTDLSKLFEAMTNGKANEAMAKAVDRVATAAGDSSAALEAGIDRSLVERATAQKPFAQRSLTPIEDALRLGDTRLLKGTWLLEQARGGKVLPRRQDLPEEAFWQADELIPRLKGGPMGSDNTDGRRVRLLAVSYCWLSPSHPDPDGEQLRTLGAALELRLHANPKFRCVPDPDKPGRDTRFPKNNGYNPSFPIGQMEVDGAVRNCELEDVAIFFDWGSMHQMPRTDDESCAFKRSLASVNLWYTHSESQVWVLSLLPASAPSTTATYSQRGWPFFESAIAGLLHDKHNLIDLGVLASGPAPTQWADLIGKRTDTLGPLNPPMTTSAFVAGLSVRRFTNSADHAFVSAKFAQTMAEVLASAYELKFHGVNWGDTEMEALAGALAWTRSLDTLSIGSNKMGPEGAKAIAAVLPQCTSLRRIFIDGNKVGDKGIAAFREVLPQLAPNHQFYCSNCGLSPAAGQQMRAAYDAAGHTGLLQGDHTKRVVS